MIFMQKYQTTCTCGDVMTVDASSKEEAVEKLKAIMNANALAMHMAEKHVGQPVPTLVQAHAMIAQTTQLVV